MARNQQRPLTAEQVRDHAALVRPGVLGNAVVALVLASVQRDVFDDVRILSGLSFLIVPFTWRMVLARRWRQSPDAATPAAWLLRFRAGYAVQGLAWGIASLVLFPPGDVTHQVFLTFALGGLTAAAITLTAFDLVAGLAFLVISLVPMIARLVLEGGNVQTSMAAVVALFLSYMAVNAARAHRRWREGEEHRRVADDRAEELRALNENLEQVVDQRSGALRASEERLRHALDATNDGLWDVDLASRVAYYSPAWARVLGYDPAEIEPAPDFFWRRLHPDDVSRVETATTAHLEGRTAVMEVEVRLRCKDGSYRWFLDRGKVVAYTDDGRPRRMVGAITDVTERREAMRAQHESEARFRAVFDESPTIIALISLKDHRLVEVNGAWQAAFGYRRDEAIGRTSGDLGLWIDPEARRRTLDALVARGAVSGVEAQMRRKNGDLFWVLISSSTITIAGEPYSLSSLVDVTDRNRAQRDLAESEARFRAVFDKGPIVISLVRLADDRFVEVNDAALQAFGYARGEVIGRSALELDLWVDLAERAKTIELLRAQGFVSGLEVRLRRKGGEQFWALFSSSIIAIGGEPYSLSTLQDVTERRQLEARVLQSQKMEVLGHLAGGVAHDFNNVLTVIRSTAELGLETAGEGTELHEALETIRDASARASGLTSQLLAFSRRQVLQPMVVDLNHLVRDLTPMLRRAIGERIALETTAAPGPATILADRSSIEQVILNLAINARDAMSGGGLLRIAVEVVAAPSGRGRHVALTITDTGVGMSDATLQRVFEPFFTTKEVGKGTGLGLSTAHGIVTQSGGEIAVRSTPGAGTTFTLSLPWIERTPDRAPQGRRTVIGGDETILVVDDDADIRDVVRRALSSAGYQVLLSASGDDALQLLGRHAGQVHLLLTDLVMPGISGQDLAEQVHVDHPSVRILYSSGFVDDAVVENGGLADVPFIAKPYSLKALTQKVREVLDAERPN